MTDETADHLAGLWPPFGLRVTCGPLVLRAMRDTDLPEVLALVHAGIHAPDQMPFYVPWTRAQGVEAERGFMQFHWQQRAKLAPNAWSVDLGVWHDGTFVGMQGVGTTDFLVTRTGETGSWLGRQFHRRGIGTLMRQAMCVLCLDHLGFTEVTSAAFSDNPASLGVSRKVGYRSNGRVRMSREGASVTQDNLVLRPDDLRRPPHEVQVSGAGAFRQLIGLDQPDGTEAT